MTTLPSVIPLLILALLVICGLVRLAEQEYRDQAFANLMRKYTALRPFDKIMVGLLLAAFCQHGGSKPTNWLQEISGPQIETNTVDAAEQDEDEQDSGMAETPLSNEFPRLTSNQYAAGFALLTRTYTNATWLTVPSNAIAHAPWTRYGLAEDTFWLSATNWAFILGTNAVEGAHVSSSGTLSFNPATPKGSPRASTMPDGDTISFLAPLQGWLGTVPPEGRFWHAVTTNSSMLMTWQNLYAGRDTNTPVTFQAELYCNGDFVYRYAFTNALALTNFVIGAQHNGGGETYALDATNMLANGLELRWRWFGLLDPGVDDHDGDGLSTYEEVMTHDSDPTMPDTDLDGLGDAQEDPVNGPFPRNRDSDNDGFTDGADPHPMSADSTADHDGDSLPDAWEVYAFGGTNVTDNATADTNGDGFSDRVSMLAGICPTNAPAPGFAVTNAAAFAGIDAWEIAPVFALNMQAGLTNVITRTLQISRTSPWQQYFVSSDPRSAQAWSLDGLELSWSGANVAGSATSSPYGDSLRLGLGTNMPATLSFCLTPTRSQGLLRSARPLYLVRWSPQPVFTSSETVASAVSSNGVRYTAALLTSAFAPALPFTLNPGLRPHKAAPDPDELAELTSPPDPSSYAYAEFSAGLASGTLTAPEPSAASLPAYGTNAAVRVLLYRFEIIRNARIVLDRPLGQYAAPFPLDTAALRDKWRANAAATESLGIDGFSVYTGISDPAFTVRINGEARDWYAWDEGGSSRAASSSLMTLSALEEQSPCGDGAAVGADLCTSNLVDQCVDRDPENDDSDSGGGTSENSGGDPEEDETCDSCESGDCGEGPQLNSLKFRIPLGNRGRGRVSGFLWFAIDAPRAVDRSLFSVLADDSVYTETNEAAMTVACFAERGRTLAVSNVTCGVRIWVSEASGALEHTWEITNPGNDAGVMRIVQRDQAGNRKTDKTYAYNPEARYWLCTDGLDGHTESLTLSGAVGPGSTLQEFRVRSVAGNTVSSEITLKTAFGEGAAAVGRVTQTDTFLYDSSVAAGTYLRKEYAYWTDSLHPRRNGLLKYSRGGGEAWIYHAYDERGRTVLSAEQLDGSTFPEALASSGDIDTIAELAAIPGLACRARTYSYGPVAGTDDTGGHNDSRKPRTLSAYAVRDGTASAVSREWRVLTRGQTEAGLPTLSIRTVRAASAEAAYGDTANAVAETLAYAGSEDATAEPLLWDLPLSETSEDGTLRTWAYERGNFNPATGSFTADNNGAYLRVTARTGTAAMPQGVENLSTYEVEIRDAAFGQTLRRETRLHGGGDPLLSWEESAFDAKGRLLGSRYSDGTGATNVWDCCRLTAVIGRDGRRTDTLTIPEQPNFSVSIESSLASLPGANGLCPAVETYRDPLGRVTNSVRRAYTYPGLTGSSAYPMQNTSTRLPYGVDGYSETTDPFGVVTVHKRGYGANWAADETAAAGVTGRVTKTFGGATVTLRQWTDPVSGITHSLEKRTESSWDSAGLETVTVNTRSGGGAWIVESATSRDFLGRTVAVAAPGFNATLITSNAYDNAGRTLMTFDRDGSRTAYAYTALGDPAGTVRIGAGQTLQFDPHSFTLAQVIAMGTYVVTETPAWKEYGDLGLASNGVQQAWWDCSATVLHNPGQGSVTASVQRVQLTGLSAACVKRTVATDINGDVTVTTESLEAGDARTTVTSVNTATAASAASVSVAGVQTGNTNSIGSATSYTFDGFARQVTATETAGSRTLQRATGYHSDGSVAFSAEICGSVTNVTSYSQRQYQQQPEGAYTVTTTDVLGNGTVSYYSGDGTLYRSEGAVYPTATARDADGRQSELRTWRDESENPDITRWHYDLASGLVTNKVYADGKGPAYAYRADGQILSRTWARGTVTEYGYADTADGSAMTVSYSDGTPAVSNGYNLAGQLVYVSDGTGGRTLSYNSKGQQTAETNLLAAITRHYDGLGRDAGYELDLPGFGADTFSVSYGHDGAGRLDRVVSVFNGVTNTFCYSFLQGTAIVTGMTNSAGLGWTRTFEPERNLIAAVSNSWSGTAVSSFAYENDALGRRTQRLDKAPSLSATNVFAYNQRSEVTNAAMGAWTYSYAYDDIGNRQTSSVNAVPSSFTANSLNQYTAITGDLARPVAYDLDGNMTVNGDWLYDWDGENNLWLAQQAVQTNGSLLVENGYDFLKRRWYKRVDVLTGQEPPSGSPPMPGEPGIWVPSKTTYYVWDGWNIAAEINIDETAGTTNITRYVWGLDLSGSIQGAGGVGGLLAVIEDDGSVYYPCYDANGNVTEYVDESGTVRAHREFDAFGNTTAKSGDLADSFKFWFSTKYLDQETGNYVYQQRQDIPSIGRWASRDPIDEEDGFNLYCWIRNATMNLVDTIGLSVWNWDSIDLGSRSPFVKSDGSGQLKRGETYNSKWNLTRLLTYTYEKRGCSKIEVYADGEAQFWWSYGQPAHKDNLTPLQHEVNHVRMIWLQWRELQNAVSVYTDKDFASSKAACYGDIIRLLFDAHRHISNAINFGYDVVNGDSSLASKRDSEQRLARECFTKIEQKQAECSARR